jgi:hypothetical protein
LGARACRCSCSPDLDKIIAEDAETWLETWLKWSISRGVDPSRLAGVPVRVIARLVGQ